MGRVLTDAEIARFDRDGYVVVPGAVPRTDCDAVVADMWKHLGLSSRTLDDCYRRPLRANGFVEMFQTQSMWNNRQNPRVYGAFADLFDHAMGRSDLWVSIDRCALKLPASAKHPEFQHPGFTHWDYDPTAPHPTLQLQGVLALADTPADAGGFHCYPGMHRYLPRLISSLRSPIAPSAVETFYARTLPILSPVADPAWRALEHHVVPCQAGDLIIWRGELAHGNGLNRSSAPRLAQYMTMFPAMPSDARESQRRVSCWRKRLCGMSALFPQVLDRNPDALWMSADVDRSAATPAVLTELGERLLGAELWA
eukprot:TRINITY_DN7223_c0_g1_i2.p1 TRINITY_DN7223_c0_g1~~TRINITY_DN7223_c0_g1_i2.p1  ORF type:complete len:311 (+),score=49.68 TRINITY_DN7223_c0_g1_i2:3-935(+)